MKDRNENEIEFVWHGSPNGNIKCFEPRESTQKGKFVYAAKDFEVAAVFGFRMSSIERDLGYYGGKLTVTERMKDYFKEHDRPIYIYKLPAKDFEYFEEDNWGNHEVRTNKNVEPIDVIKFDSGFDLLKKLAEEGLIDLYIYPNKPKNLSKNDNDVVKHIVKYYSMNPEKHGDGFEELKRFFPKFAKVADFLGEKLSHMTQEEARKYAEKVYDRKNDKLSPELERLVEIEKRL